MALRVIGGYLKGKKLLSIKGETVRPTANRVRETIFNILSAKIPGSVMLDLFSGTGAFGIEAISRGAQFTIFIDKNRESQMVVKKNIRSCAIEDKTQIIRWDVSKNLNCLNASEKKFNLVFMDPPYNQHLIESALFHLHQSKTLENGADIIVEHALSEPIPEHLRGFCVDDQRRFGKTLVSFLSYMI